MSDEGLRLHSLVHLARLVEMREKIGSFLLQLARVQRVVATPNELAVANLLLGIGFSLWRAAFLIDERRANENVRDHAVQFLDTLLWDNTIAYSHDKTSKAWTAGFYVNNAVFRTIELGKYYGLAQSEPFAKLPEFLDQALYKYFGPPDLEAGWQLCYDGAAQGLTILASGDGQNRRD